jgi:fumarate reductase flavoprotein subunit
VTDFDVVIVGSGAAGLCAALEAADQGASVLVVDSEEVVGGSSRLSGGIIMGAGTKHQAAAGIVDSADELFHDYMALNQWKLEAAVIRRLADECGHNVDWLVGHGVEYLEQLYFSGDERVPRCHVPAAGGPGVIEVLHSRCKARPEIEFALKRRVDRILVEDGRVAGVAVEDDEVRADAVVIASGGFGANPDLIGELYPDAAAAGDWIWYIGADSSRGDALGLAEQVSAQIIGNNRGLLLLTPDFGRKLEIYFPGWLIAVNALGRRFFDETAPYSVTEPLVKSQPGPIYAIFDDAAKKAAQAADAGSSKKQDIPAEQLEYNWVEPVIEDMVAHRKVVKADSIATVAELIGVPAEHLEGTIEGYNDSVAAGSDQLYLKNPALMSPISQPPFYATELRLANVCLTSTGLRINREARVLNARTQPIAGLYAAGECTGGVLGDLYVGSGNSWANCVAFGRIAGRNAAAERARTAQSLSANTAS